MQPRIRSIIVLFGLVIPLWGVAVLVGMRNSAESDQAAISEQTDTSEQAEEAMCHDLDRLFPDGVGRISAKFWVEVDTGVDDWPAITETLQQFALNRSWSFRNTSMSQPGVVQTLELSTCAPGQPVIVVNYQSWELPRPVDFPRPPPRAIGFAFYGEPEMPENVWQTAAADLVRMLEAGWSDRVRFRDENSNLSYDRPDFIQD